MESTTTTISKPKVGDIWMSVYHYYDTSYDFYKVVDVKPKQVVFAKLEKSGYGNYNGGTYYVRPTKVIEGKPFAKMWTGRPIKNGYQKMYPWDGNTKEESHGNY